MSLWTRVRDVLRGDGFNRELDEEFESHIDEAVASGRDVNEARRAFGSRLRQREASRSVRVAGWLDGLRADVIFGWRQLRRNRVTSAAAVLSLALAMGACVSAFRLIDALLLRPLPVVHPERLYGLARHGFDSRNAPNSWDGWAYPDFVLMRAAAKGDAELIATSYTDRLDLTYATDEEMEKGYVQYVSGWMFDSLGLKPALGRLFTEADDRSAGAHPYAVLSYDYWTRRFGRDPKAMGRTLRLGDQLFEIVGVGPETFTGTEPGTVTEIFLPTMMHRWVTRPGADWHRALAIVRPDVAIEPLRAKLEAVSEHFDAERLKGAKGLSEHARQSFANYRLSFDAAASGVSVMQEDYRRALTWIGVLVGLVLLIACTNVANLMTAQSASRAREMALRVSIGAGRARLVQMVMVESAMLALGAAGLGSLLAWQAAPLVVRLIGTPDNPARLILPADWRVLGFGVALLVGVMLLFGLLPALRASAVKPADALKGGALASGSDPLARRRMMHGMIAAQVAFCFLVVFVAGLFVATFNRLSHKPLGFDTSGLLLLESVAPHGQMPAAWAQMGETLRAVPGVAGVAESGWPLMSTGSSNGSIALNGGPPSVDWGYFLTVSPGWFETMKMRMIAGREFRASDAFPGAAVVNETFVRMFLVGSHPSGNFDPVGMTFEKPEGDGTRTCFQVVGVVADAPYRYVREATLPVAFMPYRSVDAKGVVQPENNGTFLVRVKVAKESDLLALGAELRRKVAQAGAGFRVSNVRTQQGLLDAQTVRERMLAMLGVFFAGVALLMAGIGLYGVLNYSVLQRRREVGIRLALGARRNAIARLVAGSVFGMVAIGVLVGVALGLGSARYIEALFYQVKASDARMLMLPSAVILVVVLVATVPAVLRALRVNPAEILRAE
jgi:putative ABC transport system permease protein